MGGVGLRFVAKWIVGDDRLQFARTLSETSLLVFSEERVLRDHLASRENECSREN
jgi:hypothetical protein